MRNYDFSYRLLHMRYDILYDQPSQGIIDMAPGCIDAAHSATTAQWHQLIGWISVRLQAEYDRYDE